MVRFRGTAITIAACAAWAMALIPGALEAGEGDAKPATEAKTADADVRKAVDDYLKTKGVGDTKDAVTVGTGKMKIGALLQIWYSYNENDNKTTRGQPNEGNDNDSFRIRRAEIKLSGEITPEVKWTVMIDPARSLATTDTAASSVMQDAYIELGFIKYHTIWIGQGKRPIGREGNWSSGRLPLPERAMLSRDPSNGDTRDLGIKIVGEYKDTPADWFTWQLGFFQGAGWLGQAHQNRPDDNDDKDILSRLVVRLFGKQGALFRDGRAGDFEIGFSRLDGKQGERRRRVTATATTFGIYEDTWHYAMGFDLEYRYKFKESGELWLAGEYFECSNRPAYNTAGLSAATLASIRFQPDQRVNQNGWYALIAYKLGGTGVKELDNKIEWVYRYERWDNIIRPGLFPNTDLRRGHFDVFKTEVHTAGINYYIKGHNAKIQLAYDFVNDPNGTRKTDRHGFREARNDVCRLNVQITF